RQRPEHVDVPTNDRRKIETVQLGASARGSAQDDTASAPRSHDRLTGCIGRPCEFDDENGRARKVLNERVIDGLGNVARIIEPPPVADEVDLSGSERPCELCGALSDRPRAEHEDALACLEPTTLERP